MAKQFQCPGNELELLVRAVTEDRFYLAFTKPDRTKIEARIRAQEGAIADWPDNLRQMVDKEYNPAMQIYEIYQPEREAFIKYFGVNPESAEDIEDFKGVRLQAFSILRRHVSTDSVCRDTYFGFLEAEVTMDEEKIRDKFKQSGKVYDRDLVLKALDEQYLGLIIWL